MGLFKRKKDEEAKIRLEQEALDQLNSNNDEGFYITAESTDNNSQNSEWKISGKIKAPHSITPEELNKKTSKTNSESTSEIITEEIPMVKSDENNNTPSGFLYQKMMESRAKNQEDTIQIEEIKEQASLDDEKEDAQQIPADSVQAPLDIEAAINDIRIAANLKTDNPQTQKDEDIIVSDTDEASVDSDNIKEDEDEPIVATESPNINSGINKTAEERRATLLARCNAYLEDANDTLKIDTEKYRLESVESILESVENRVAERISKKFNTSPAVNTAQSDSQMSSHSETFAESTSATIEDTVVFQPPVTEDSTKTADTTEATPPTSNNVKHIFVAEQSPTQPQSKSADFSDISSTKILTDISSHSKPINTPPSDKTSVLPIVDTAKNQSDFVNPPPSYEENSQKMNDGNYDFEDYTSIADAPKIFKSLSKNRKKFTLKATLSTIVFIASLFLLIPINGGIFTSKTTINILDLIFCILVLFINMNILSSLKYLFTSKSKNSLPAALSVLAATLFAVINIIFNGDFVGFSSVTALSLTSYNFANKNFYSKTIKNFKLIANSEFKNAVSIIQNKNATKTIVGKSIEGSSLVCYGGETTNIHNFLKYSFCENPISEKIQKLSLISIIIGFALTIATLLLNATDAILSIYIFCATVCFSAIPSVYHIISLTINSANKRLNHYGAMITGYAAADELELCNAVAIDSNSLFPDGTIRFVDMKLLSHNPIDQSILDALAIASAINSPIAGIFKQMDITKAYENSIQEADSVIYEEKMGISGWVNDRRVFVGNRDLLIAHGFNGLPPAELDKKIMRKGYFPVYIASDNIPCALLVVKYEPDQDIVYEMQRLANTGTTIIVNNCDPNINARMLTDYFYLYDETVYIMNKQGSDTYQSLISHKEHRSSGAAYKSRIEGLLASLTASINIKKYISRMTVFYICSIVLGLLALITCILSSQSAFITPLNILLTQIVLTAITLLPTVLRKP